MRTINFETYYFDELPKSAQSKALDEIRYDVMQCVMDGCKGEFEDTLNEFELITGCKCTDYRVGLQACWFKFEFDEEDPESIKGKHLLRWVNKHILWRITKGKYYHINGKTFHSKVTKEVDPLNLTGVFCDYSLLNPMVEYVKAYKTISEEFSLYDLMQDCFSSFFTAWRRDYEYFCSDEGVMEDLECNDRVYEFLEDGTRYKG